VEVKVRNQRRFPEVGMVLHESEGVREVGLVVLRPRQQ
jgi:hypothetical protein